MFGTRSLHFGPHIGVGIGTSVAGGLLLAIAGDSNGKGQGDSDHADGGFRVATPNPSVPYNARYANSVTNPPVFVDFSTNLVMRSLAPYAAGGGPNMGLEITLGPEVLGAGLAPSIAKYAITGATLATEWLPTANYPTVGPNLFTSWVARMRAFGGRVVPVISLGTNDAADTTQASAFQANMTAFIAATRAAFGSTTPIVWIKTNANTTNTFASVVRAAQVAVALLDPLLILVDNDDLTLSDGLHYFPDGYLTLGQRCAFAALDALGVARSVPSVTPDVIGRGPAAHGAGALAPVGYGGARANDREYMSVTAGLLNVPITTPVGWTLIANTSVTSTFAVTNKQQGAVYERLVTQVMLDANAKHTAATAVLDTNDLNCAQIYCVRGPSGAPSTDVSSGSVNDALGTSLSLTGVTTTVPNTRVLMFAGGFTGAGTNSLVAVNAALTNVVEKQDSTNDIGSDFQMSTLTAGTKATAGATGAATVTSASNAIFVGATVAVKP